jgi:hypothetical protein
MFALAVGFLAAAQPAGALTPAQAVEIALKSHLPAKSYHLVARSTSLSNVDGKLMRQVIDYEVWVSGDKVRTDSLPSVFEPSPKQVGMRRILCRNCERPGYALSTMRSPSAVSAVTFDKIDAKFDDTDPHRIDWRALGLYCGNIEIYATRPYEGTLRALASRAPKLEPARDAGIDYLTLTMNANNSRRTCWLRPDQAFRPTRITTQGGTPPGGNPAKRHLQETTAEYTLHKPSGAWLPKTFVHIRKFGDDIQVDQRVELDFRSVNEPIPDKVFTLAGFDLQIGTPVELPEIKKKEDAPTWQESGLDKEKTMGKQAAAAYYGRMKANPVPDQPQRSGAGRWAYFVGAAVLAVVGGLVLRRVVFRRS